MASDHLTISISICAICDEGRDPIAVPDGEYCGHDASHSRLVTVPVVPAAEIEALRAERDRYREALTLAAEDIETIITAGFDSSRREAAEAGLERIRAALQEADL